MNKKELIAELKKLGLSDEVLSGIKDDQLEGMVKSLKPKTLDFDDFLKDTKNQAEFDRRVTKALETAKKKTEDPKQDPIDQIEVKGEQPEWLKAVLEQNQAILGKIDNLEKGTVAKSKTDQAKSFLSKSKLPEKYKESWLNRIDINSETPIEEQVNGLTKEYEDLVQSVANDKNLGGAPPKPGFDKEPTKEELDKFITI